MKQNSTAWLVVLVDHRRLELEPVTRFTRSTCDRGSMALLRLVFRNVVDAENLRQWETPSLRIQRVLEDQAVRGEQGAWKCEHVGQVYEKR